MTLISIITAFWISLHPMDGPPLWIIHGQMFNDTGGQEIVIQDVERDQWYMLLLGRHEVEAYTQINPLDMATCGAPRLDA